MKRAFSTPTGFQGSTDRPCVILDTVHPFQGEESSSVTPEPSESDLAKAHIGACMHLAPGTQYLIFHKPGQSILWLASVHIQGFTFVGQFTVPDA